MAGIGQQYLPYDLDPSIQTDMSALGVQPAQNFSSPSGTWKTLGTIISPGVGTVVGSTIDLLAGVWDYYATKKEMERLEKKADKRYEREWDRNQTRYDEEMGITMQGIRTANRERRKQWEWKSEDRNYQRGREFVNHFLGTIAQQPALENRLLSIWPNRRSA